MSDVEAASATEIPPGTLVMLGHFAAHIELDLAWAFRSIGWEVAVWGNDDEGAFNDAIHDTLAPALVLYPNTGGPLFPSLVTCHLPTAVFMHDSHRYVAARLLKAQLFDIVFARNPGSRFERLREGHRRVVLVPHAVAHQDFEALHLERDLEVGWVGTSRAPIYRRRRELLPRLAREFVMNDWERRYPPVTIPSIYGRSKIVVNISRDDWPADANTRVFEAMAAGAMLVTSLPTDLTALGFTEGVHFVGYRDEAALVDVLRGWLDDDAGRATIAAAGRDKVLAEFTYEQRARAVARIVVDEADHLLARRTMSRADAAAIAFEVYLKERRWSALLGRWLQLVAAARLRVAPALWRGFASMVGRAILGRGRGDLHLRPTAEGSPEA